MIKMNFLLSLLDIFRKPPLQAPRAVPLHEDSLIPGNYEWYQYLWSKAIVNNNPDVAYFMHKLMEGKDRYKYVQQQTGVPWQLIGCLHGRESSFNFNSCLHNGDPLGYITTHVPKGRGPFYTWEQSAVDALSFNGFTKVHDYQDLGEEDWNIAKALRKCEKYNGFGYLLYHTDCKSPYIWSCTNKYVSGKYGSDGKFNPFLKDRQPGVAAILLRLKEQQLLEIPE